MTALMFIGGLFVYLLLAGESVKQWEKYDMVPELMARSDVFFTLIWPLVWVYIGVKYFDDRKGV